MGIMNMLNSQTFFFFFLKENIQRFREIEMLGWACLLKLVHQSTNYT